MKKRATLTIPNTTEQVAKPEEQKSQMFMIPFSALHAFDQLMKKHKKKAKKLAKTDDGYLHIHIGTESLESFGCSVEYKQPAFSPVDFENDFMVQRVATNDFLYLSSKEVDSVMKGFDGTKPVKITMCGDKNPIHFYQESTGFEAVLEQTEPEEE